MLSREGEAAGGRAARELQNAPYAVGSDLAATVTGGKLVCERVCRGWMCQDGVCVCAGSEIHFPNFTPRTVDEPQTDRSETRLSGPLRRSST